eukprot:scaffold52336_cov37-Phaeocystis_antarctica.AAC.1
MSCELETRSLDMVSAESRRIPAEPPRGSPRDCDLDLDAPPASRARTPLRGREWLRCSAVPLSGRGSAVARLAGDPRQAEEAEAGAEDVPAGRCSTCARGWVCRCAIPL